MLPQLSAKADNTTMINAFSGYNHNSVIQEGQFYDMKNMSCDEYPVLVPRKRRGIYRRGEQMQGMLGGEYLTFVDNNVLYFKDEEILKLKDGGERQLVMMGALLCVFPDGVIYNTQTNEITYIDNCVTTKEPPRLTLCRLDGVKFDDSNTVTSDTEPTDKKKYWLDTSQQSVVLKMYSASSSMWVSIPTTYVKVEAEGIGKGFKANDAATFSGVDKNENVYNNWNFNQSNIIYAAEDDYLIITGLIKRTFVNSRNITVERKMPEFDYCTELNNRIWACSSKKHEVYACKQGDPTNWYCYAGLDNDSYASTIGTEGEFTGIVSYNDSIYFFKENGYHRLYGNRPANYEITWNAGKGVQKGSGKSIAVVNNCLIYKSMDSVVMYDGSINSISNSLGTLNYYDAVGGYYRNKYYLSMRNENYDYAMYVYDTAKNMWSKEDGIIMKYMSYGRNSLFMCDDNNVIYLVTAEALYMPWHPMSTEIPEKYMYPAIDNYPGYIPGGEEEKDFEWSAITGEIGLDTPFKKYIKKLYMRMQLEENAKFMVEIQYDSTGDWEKVIDLYCTRKKSYEIPIPVIRCDHMTIRISGFGKMKLYSIAKVVEEGSGK